MFSKASKLDGESHVEVVEGKQKVKYFFDKSVIVATKSITIRRFCIFYIYKRYV